MHLTAKCTLVHCQLAHDPFLETRMQQKVSSEGEVNRPAASHYTYYTIYSYKHQLVYMYIGP